ncbi:MAG: class I SAM-dependent methyltransferase [Thermodesulfobacteriota bacterium]
MTEHRELPDWEQRYSDDEIESMPWFYPDLDPDIEEALTRFGISSGRVLDLGADPGTQAIALARKGFHVTATDILATAVRKGAERARSVGVAVDFLVDDIVESRLEGKFDLIFDRGCFHALSPEQRGEYVERTALLPEPGGFLFLKCFSHRETMKEGPYHFTPEQIEEIFSSDFLVRSIDETVFHGTLESYPKALFSTIERR